MGRFKTPEGVTVNVDDELAERIGGKWSPADGEGGGSTKSETPGKSWKVDELKSYAAEHDIDLGEATKKDEILAVIVAATPAE